MKVHNRVILVIATLSESSSCTIGREGELGLKRRENTCLSKWKWDPGKKAEEQDKCRALSSLENRISCIALI